jgi:hypothetical protein
MILTFYGRKVRQTASNKLQRGNKKTMRFDLLIIAIGLLLLVAMTLTLLFGREYSRHGYGAILSNIKEGPSITA